MSNRRKINVGDRITFKAITRWNSKKVTRVVTGFDREGRPQVRFGGWPDFIVMPQEITLVEPKAEYGTGPMAYAQLNVGLARSGGGSNSLADTIRALQAEGLHPYRYQLWESPTELTLCVRVRTNGSLNKLRGRVYAACLPLDQDCIALVPQAGADGAIDFDRGKLVGPRADAWGAFDPALFCTCA